MIVCLEQVYENCLQTKEKENLPKNQDVLSGKFNQMSNSPWWVVNHLQPWADK